MTAFGSSNPISYQRIADRVRNKAICSAITNKLAGSINERDLVHSRLKVVYVVPEQICRTGGPSALGRKCGPHIEHEDIRARGAMQDTVISYAIVREGIVPDKIW